MAGTPILATFGWLAAPLFKSIKDKAYNYLGTYIFNEARDFLSTSTDTSIKKRRKVLEDKMLPILPRLSLAIDKAEKSPKKEKLVDWLERLKAAYYEAEEAIDLLDYEQLEQKVMDGRKALEQTEKNERRVQISLTPQFVSRPLKSCIDKLKKLEEEADEFRDLLVPIENDRDTFSEPPSKVFGREKDKENIVGLLTKKPLNSEAGPSTRPAIPIIAITGRSGVGKTALAQYVYKHMDEHDHFDIRVWVHAPRKFKATDVIKIMTENIEGKTDSPTNDEALLKHTRNMVGSKKLLLVLDDFWSDDTMDFHEQWEKFFKFLSSCSPGSKILLTTQSKNTTDQAGLAGVTDAETYNLKEIEEDHFLKLFMHYAWPSNSHLQKVEVEKTFGEFEEIGKTISFKLKGDPGAAKLVGHQLSGKLDLKHWKEVAQKDWLRDNMKDNMKARIWSYQQLSHDLQRCFAICSLFPKGVTFPRMFLINLWMAEGFIRLGDKEERLEDIGEKYLHKLVSRFFIEEVEVGEEKRYQLHDLLHDLAERVQGDDFIRIDSTNSREVSSHISDMLSRSENIRHILLPSSMINKLKEKICLMKNIRTFWVKHDGGIVPINVLQEILEHLEKLRVLFLVDCVDDLPDSFGKLKHLRYLSINVYQSLKKIPNSICKLYHLQNLSLINSESLPKDFCELISLRQFDTSKETISHISHVGRLTSLQKLDHFVVRKECGYELQQLENLNQLRGEMCIAGLENVRSTEDARKAHMKNKKYLEALTFEWNSDERDTDDVAGLCTQHVELLEALQPQHNISHLTLKGFGGDKFPNWIVSKNSQNHLTIEESLPNCRSLILQRLNNLKEMPSLPPNLTYLEIDLPEIDLLPKISYFPEDDLLMDDERPLDEVEKQICPCLLGLQEDTFCRREKCKLVNKLVLPSSITILKISSCKIGSDALSTCIQSLVSLPKLELSNIRSIFSLPPKEVLCSLKNLQSLTIRDCTLDSLGGIGALTSLIELELNGCIMLDISNDSLPSSLERIKFHDCSDVEVLLAESYLPVLRHLNFKNFEVYNQMRVLHVGNLSCLKSLYIEGWNGRLEGLNSLTALNDLFVTGCPKINLSSPLAKYASALPMVGVDDLSVLKLILSNEISSLENLVILFSRGDSFDDEVSQSLTSLKLLHFIRCNITHLPKYLKNLTSLQYMELVDCPNLCEFELEELPKNLRKLQIESCPNLKFNKGVTYRPGYRKEMTIVTFPMEEEGNRF